MRRFLPAAGALALLVIIGAGCGKKGALRPPEPRGPTPPREVAARQIGEAIDISFVVPAPRGPRPSQQPILAELVRVAYGPGVRPPQDPDAFRRAGVIVAKLEGDPLGSGGRLAAKDASWRDLAGTGVNWTLRYAVRVRDRRGRPSPLVVAPDLVPVAPPPAPTALRAEATADGVRLSWEPPKEEGTPKYNVYRAERDQPFGDKPLQLEPVTSAEYLDSGVVLGKSYRYAVRTAVSDGAPFRESESSPEVEVRAEDRFPPAAPTGMVAVQEGQAVRLFWNPNQERDLAGYRVSRRNETGAWQRIGPDLGVEPFLLDPEVRPGDRVSYRVTAVDRAGNESPPSETVAVDVVKDTGAAPESGR
ncbi:MAG: hypothetical protein LAO51_01710 [Acidobacteriia bacterium]|nr:hypothetical protein [Terriglobia bacterium]